MHTCHPRQAFSTLGGSLKTHQPNPNKHPNCNHQCPGFHMLHKPGVAGDGEPKKSTLVEMPLRVLMVLGSDFRTPKNFERNANYEIEASFDTSVEGKEVPGFTQNSFIDKKKKCIKSNCWVRRTVHTCLREH